MEVHSDRTIFVRHEEGSVPRPSIGCWIGDPFSLVPCEKEGETIHNMLPKKLSLRHPRQVMPLPAADEVTVVLLTPNVPKNILPIVWEDSPAGVCSWLLKNVQHSKRLAENLLAAAAARSELQEFAEAME